MKYNSVDQIKSKNGTGTPCGTREKHTEYWSRNLKERYHLEDIAIEGTIILKWALKRMGQHSSG